MSYVTLEQAKRQLLVVHDQDDEHIQDLIDAAEAYCAGYMNRAAITDEQDCPWYLPRGCCAVSSSEVVSTVPRSVVQAVLLVVTDFYERRTTEADVGNTTATNLLDQQRVGQGI